MRAPECLFLRLESSLASHRSMLWIIEQRGTAYAPTILQIFGDGSADLGQDAMNRLRPFYN